MASTPNTLVDTPDGLAADSTAQSLEAESVLTQCHRPFRTEVALLEPGQCRRVGVIGAVDEPQIFTPAYLQTRLHEPLSFTDQPGGNGLPKSSVCRIMVHPLSTAAVTACTGSVVTG